MLCSAVIIAALQAFCKVTAIEAEYAYDEATETEDIHPNIMEVQDMVDQGPFDSETAKIIRCSCGVELRDANANEERLIQETQSHAKEAHKLELSDEQVRAMMEIEQ
jgi:predicted small metal-binding protein